MSDSIDKLDNIIGQIEAGDEVAITTDAAALAERIFAHLQNQAVANGGAAFLTRHDRADSVELGERTFSLTRAVRVALGFPEEAGK